MNFDDFLKKIKEIGLTKEDFSELTGLNSNTLKGWATKRQGRKTQKWVESWLQLYKNCKDQNIIIEALKK